MTDWLWEKSNITKNNNNKESQIDGEKKSTQTFSTYVITWIENCSPQQLFVALCLQEYFTKIKIITILGHATQMCSKYWSNRKYADKCEKMKRKN